MNMPTKLKTLDDLNKVKITQAIEGIYKRKKGNAVCVIPNKFWQDLSRVIKDCQLAKSFENNRDGWNNLKKQIRKILKAENDLYDAMKVFGKETYAEIITSASIAHQSGVFGERLAQDAFTSPKEKHSGMRNINNPPVYDYGAIDADNANSVISGLEYLTHKLHEVDIILDKLQKSEPGKKEAASRSNFIIGLIQLLYQHFRITVKMGKDAYQEYKHPFADLLDATVCAILQLDRLETCNYAVTQLKALRDHKKRLYGN